MKKQIGLIGLGKMGQGLALNLLAHGWRVVVFNRTAAVTRKFAKRRGLSPAYSIEELASKQTGPRLVWLMVPAFTKVSADGKALADRSAGRPAGKPVDEMLFGKNGVTKYLKRGDYVIDGGNSFYKDTVRRARRLKKLGLRFLDAGVSGGPKGARHGACIMVGGTRAGFKKLENLFRDLTVRDGYGYFGSTGAGHFVKMVHNGIEYGMMQAIAEGFTVLKKSPFKLDLKQAAKVYNHGSVIESRLMGWLEQAFQDWGTDLKSVSGKVSHSGEGEWTVKVARELKVPAKVIEQSFQFRVKSQKNPSFTGQIVSALRGQFGGHSVKKK